MSSSSLSRPLSLLNIHQLQQSPPLTPRVAVARAFKKDDQWGLIDHSGALWPVAGGPLFESCACQWDWVEVCFHLEAPCRAQSVRVVTKASRPELTNSLGHQHELAEGANLLATLVHWLRHARFLDGFCVQGPFVGLQQHECFQQALRAARSFFLSSGYQELLSPVCVVSGGMERYLRPFATTYVDHDGSALELQLPTSPEFALKKAVSRGLPKVFSLAPSFRNGGERSIWHRPQFTMLEWYTVGSSLDALIQETCDLIDAVARALAWRRPLSMADDSGGAVFGPVIKQPTRLVIPDLYQEWLGLDLLHVLQSGSPAQFYDALLHKVPSVRPDDSMDELFWKSFCDVVEPKLRSIEWAVLTGFPSGYASLAKPDGSGLLARRFEMFARGVEICNGYEELTDAQVMVRRFDSLVTERSDLKRDAAFEEAMHVGLPDCAGNALGMERLVSVLLGADEIVVDHGLGPFGVKP